MVKVISKITRAGQITLPKKIRSGRVFARASAVEFEERNNEVVIKPLLTHDAARTTNDHWPIVVHTMRDWLDEAHDDLVKFPG